MKSFIKKVAIFTFGLLVLFPLKSIYLLRHDKYKKLVNAKIVYQSIEKSKQRNRKAKILIIGDSVGQQLFSNYIYNDTICSLASNQAISLAGQYFLLNNFLSDNTEVKKVVLIYTPFDFKNDLIQKYAFGYFLKPFYTEEYKKLFSPALTEEIKRIPFYYTCQFPPILTSNWSPDMDDSASSNFMSQISEEYLSKIVELCKKDSVKFTVLPTPTRISRKPIVDDYIKNVAYANYNFKDYFSRIIYIPDSCFLDDTHLKDAQSFTGEYVKVMNDL